jgi:ankyrin repeat protein
MARDSGPFGNATDENGNTALREANGVKSAKMVELLLKNGANPLLKNKRGETMLDLAKKYGTPEIVELMENPVEQD